VHVSRASLEEILKESIIPSPDSQWNAAREVEAAMRWDPCAYYYAGRAFPSDGGLATGLTRDAETGRSGSTTSFDSGGLWKCQPTLHSRREEIYFADPAICKNYLVDRRWPNRVTCPGTNIPVEPLHLFRCLEEQCLRFNNAKLTDGERFTLAASGTVGERVKYNEITAKTGSSGGGL
jgi:hypothetical protein